MMRNDPSHLPPTPLSPQFLEFLGDFYSALFFHLCVPQTILRRNPDNLVCQHVPAACPLASWGLQLENPAAGICRIPRPIMFAKGQPWQHAPGYRHSSGLPVPLSFFGWPSFLFIYALTVQGSAKLQDLLDNLLLSKEMESVTAC